MRADLISDRPNIGEKDRRRGSIEFAMGTVTPPTRPQEFAAHAFALWKDRDKLQKDLAEALELRPETLSRWPSGRGRPSRKTAAKVIHHLYEAKCFGDPAEALDLAWLMRLTVEEIDDYLTHGFRVDTDIVRFLQWLQRADSGAFAEAPQPYLPSLPAYYVATGLAREVKEALIAPRAFRRPVHQVVVLHGGPGVGKTTTATSLLHDEQIRRIFRDGILFLPLAGEEDEKQALWRAYEQAGLPIGQEAEKEDLERVFRRWVGQENRLALLVLDDPQRAEDLVPFLDIGPQVRLLITCQDRRTVARALEERWEPTSDLIFWQPVVGLSEQEGLSLVKRWQPHGLPPDEERARQHVGELIGWHPVALRLYTAEAGDTSWQKVEALVLEGNLDPDDFGELARWVQKSWDRLPEADQQALADLRRAFREASTFGTGIAAAVWDQSPAQAQVRISRLEARALIERVTEEPPPWQEMIQHAYGGQERYRLTPLLRLMGLQPSGGQAEPVQPGTEDIKWLQAIERRAKALPIGPGQIPWQFRLANLFVLPVAWLLRRVSGRLEERLINLWNRQGLHPPAEAWLTFQKSRWTYLPFGYAIGVFLLLLGAWYLWTAFHEGDATWVFVALLAWACALPTVYLFIRQRAWWLWLLGLHGQETTELRWTWRVAGLLGLREPSNQMAILSWKARAHSSQ
jgi:transcriptional regulator with XRE-family HTH domain